MRPASHVPYHPRSMFRVRDLTTGPVVLRQAVAWHPAVKATGGAYKRHSRSRRRLVTATGYTPAIPPERAETIVEEPSKDSNESQDFPSEDDLEEQRMKPNDQRLESEKQPLELGSHEDVPLEAELPEEQ